jgi:hypothetical protein
VPSLGRAAIVLPKRKGYDLHPTLQCEGLQVRWSFDLFLLAPGASV